MKTKTSIIVTWISWNK